MEKGRYLLHGLEVSNKQGFFATNNRKPGYISFKVGKNAFGNIYSDIKWADFLEMVENFKESEEMREHQE